MYYSFSYLVQKDLNNINFLRWQGTQAKCYVSLPEGVVTLVSPIIVSS